MLSTCPPLPAPVAGGLSPKGGAVIQLPAICASNPVGSGLCLLGGAPAHGTRCTLRSLPTQTILGFSDSMIDFIPVALSSPECESLGLAKAKQTDRAPQMDENTSQSPPVTRKALPREEDMPALFANSSV